MKLQSFILTSIILAGITLTAFFGYTLISPQSAQAGFDDPLQMILTINGHTGNVSIVNGQPVEIGWYIDGPVTSCSISNGVGDIDVSVLPATGSITQTPDDDSSTNYVLSCNGGNVADPVEVDTEDPTVGMWMWPGDELTLDPLTGWVKVHLGWYTSHATRCSAMRREKDSQPGVYSTDSTASWYDGTLGLPEGRINYEGWPRVTESTTFYITCYNDNIGKSVTTSRHLEVDNPAPPPPPRVWMWSPDDPAVNGDPIYGYAYVDVNFDSDNVTRCYNKAYYEDGTEYRPSGYDKIASWRKRVSFRNIRIFETTTFEIKCTRAAYTLGGVSYPYAEDVETLRIEVDPDPDTSDRTTVPAVTASFTVDPNPVEGDVVTGKGRVSFQAQGQYADFCDRRGYDVDGNEINVPGWTGQQNGNSSYTGWADLATTTELELYCYRLYDQRYGDAAERANGTELVSEIVNLNSPSGIATPPITRIYGNATRFMTNDIWDNATDIKGFDEIRDIYGDASLEVLQVKNQGVNGSISFPFVHPFGADDEYDILLSYCDESDGVSTFRTYVNGNLTGSLTSNNPSALSGDCGWETLTWNRIGTGITISDGDTITLECDNPNDGEWCRFNGLYFGAGDGDGDGVVTAAVTPEDPTVDVGILWYSENTASCGPNIATEPDGTTYNFFSSNNDTGNYVVTTISTSTNFSTSCTRPTDGLSDTSDVDVIVPHSSGELIVSALVAAGECIDETTLTTIDAPDGYGADPVTGYCVPLVDLAAASPAVNISSAVEDGVSGTYDNLQVLMSIQNLGPGELSADNAITYMSQFTFMPALGLPDVDSPVGSYNGSLAAPVDEFNPTESATLTLDLDGIMFGTHTVCARVNLDGSPNFPEHNLDTTNNSDCGTVTLPVPRPPMSLTADREIIRVNQPVTLDWSVHTSYPLNCVVNGAGGISDTFDASQNYPAPGGAYTNAMTSTELTSTSEFILQCTEPLTNTTFSETVRVEVVPEFEET